MAKRRKVFKGTAHVLATFNNTIVTITDENGNTLVTYSPTRLGFKNARKRTAYAATQAAISAGTTAKDKFGMQEIEIRVKGVGQGRNAAIKGLAASGLRVTLIADVTKTPHNGCRPRKKPHG